MLQRVERQETEVMPKAKRRTFTAKYKREIRVAIGPRPT
jgi:hypothetical protein